MLNNANVPDNLKASCFSSKNINIIIWFYIIVFFFEIDIGTHIKYMCKR